MNEPVAPMCPIDAAALVCGRYPGGTVAMAQRLGVSVTTLRHMLNPGEASTAKLGAAQLMRICEIAAGAGVAGAWAPLDAMELQAGRMAVPLPDAKAGGRDAVAHVTGLAQEFAGLMGSFSEAVADGRVTANELDKVRTEALSLIGQVHNLLMYAAVSHASCKPAA